MANVPDVKQYVQIEATETRESIGEYLLQGIGGSTNFLLTRNIYEREFNLNGAYSYFSGKEGVDGLWVVPFDCNIFNVYLSQDYSGSTSITEVDIKIATAPFGSWNSIFTTTPKVDTTAANFGWIGIGETVAGFTAPVLVGAPANYFIAQGSALRLDVISAMPGALNLTLKMVLQTT